MILPKLPDDYEYGIMFNNAEGKALDVYGEMFNTPRRFLEMDVVYKWRLAKEGLKRRLLNDENN